MKITVGQLRRIIREVIEGEMMTPENDLKVLVNSIPELSKSGDIAIDVHKMGDKYVVNTKDGRRLSYKRVGEEWVETSNPSAKAYLRGGSGMVDGSSGDTDYDRAVYRDLERSGHFNRWGGF